LTPLVRRSKTPPSPFSFTSTICRDLPPVPNGGGSVLLTPQGWIGAPVKEFQGVYLVMRGVPYVNSRKEVVRGTLVSELSLAGDVTIKPATHVIYFAGEYPCNADGSEIGKIRAGSHVKQLDRDIVVQHLFSSKPDGGYKVHYEKMVTYAAILSGPAHEIDPIATAQTFPLIEPEDEDCVFNTGDTPPPNCLAFRCQRPKPAFFFVWLVFPFRTSH